MNYGTKNKTETWRKYQQLRGSIQFQGFKDNGLKLFDKPY